MEMDTETRKRRIYRVTFAGFAVNCLLAAGKLAAGLLGRSGAMVADAVHSFSDLATDVVVVAFARVSAKPKDEGHDYGHGKFETLAAILVGLALVAVGGGILAEGVQAIRRVVHGGELARPGGIALAAAAVSIVVKEWLYRYTVRAGRTLRSPSVVANAWHHRSDALSSLGTLAGIGCAYFLGPAWRIADPIAALLVAVFIFKIAFDQIRAGLDELLERSLPADMEQEILRIVTADPAVRQPHNLRTRRIGAAIAVEVHIRVDGEMSVRRAHALTVDIERRLRARFGAETMIAIHVEDAKGLRAGVSPADRAGSRYGRRRREPLRSARGMVFARLARCVLERTAAGSEARKFGISAKSTYLATVKTSAWAVGASSRTRCRRRIF